MLEDEGADAGAGLAEVIPLTIHFPASGEEQEPKLTIPKDGINKHPVCEPRLAFITLVLPELLKMVQYELNVCRAPRRRVLDGHDPKMGSTEAPFFSADRQAVDD